MKFTLENKLNWLYIDINSYFATIEQQVNPELRYKPVAVVPLLTDSTCAIAASYEAKQRGIKTGTRIYQARKLCPELVCIKARHELYVEYHHKIFQEIDKHLKVDHVFSIDEGACRLTGKYCLPEEAITIGKIIKEAIKKNVGDYITCSIGIASNRYLAKIASDMKKPDGITIIRPDELPQKLYGLELGSLPGIGTKTQGRILKNGINSVEELRRFDAKRLKVVWGSIWGEKVWYLIRGADLPLEETKNSTISHSQVLAPALRNVESVRSRLITLVLKVASKLRSRNLYANSILLSMEPVSRQTIIKARIKMELCCDNKNLLQAVLKSWDRLVRINGIREIKKISVSLQELQKESMQLSFDDLYKQTRQQDLSKAIDILNRKLGRNMVSMGISPEQHGNKPVIGYVPGEN